ncbi:MAG: hypothetical protein HYV45_03445 [Candidatus Moranbacteria bacterium]|nr:hypothetical protein [Candidatus Moranbacteria bacterium]
MNISWKQTWFFLVVIIFLALGIRFFALGNNSFVADEFLDINSSYGYFKTGEWRAWDFNFNKPSEVNLNAPRDERAGVYKWQVAQLFYILPPTETTARLVSVIWGVISVGIIFWAAFVFTKRKEIALLAAFLFAISVSGIIFDRTLRMYAMFFPLYLAASTMTFLALEHAYRGRISFLRRFSEKTGIHLPYAFFAGALFIFSLLTHQLTGTLVFSVGVYLLVRLIQEYRLKKTLKNKYSGIALVGVLGISIIAFFFPRFFKSFSGGLIFFDNHYGYISYVLRDYAHPLLAVLSLCFGIFWIARREKLPNASLFLFLSFFVPLLMAIWLWRRNIGVQYIFFVQSFGMVLVSAGIFGAWKIVCEMFHLTETKKMLVVFGLLVVLLPNLGYFFEENNTYHETSSGSNPNYRKVFTYFKKEHKDTDVLVTRNVRNYYFAGIAVPVYDLGDEISRTRLSVSDLEQLMRDYESGWIILSDNDYDYVGKGVKDFMNKHLIRVSNDQVRGAIDVYRW